MKSGILIRTLAAYGVLAAVALAPSPASAANARELLRRSAQVDKNLSYQGTKVLSKWTGRTEETSTAKVYHRAPNLTLMVGEDGELAGSSVLQVGQDHFVKRNGGRYRATPLPLPADKTELLLSNYRIQQQRVDHIAGRRCVMVYISPRYPGNPSKRIWLDVATGLPLKTIVYNQHGEPTEGWIFVRIQMNPVLEASRFRVPREARMTGWPRVKPNFKLISIPRKGLPPGYKLVDTSVHKVRDTYGSHIVSFQRFSDGLNTLTLLASRSHPELDRLGGNVAASGQVGRVSWVLCGEQEPEAIQRIRYSCR